MSDETTHPEDEVEAHGPIGAESPTLDSPTMDAAAAAAADEEPDVEAHGPIGAESPTMDSPTLDAPFAE